MFPNPNRETVHLYIINRALDRHRSLSVIHYGMSQTLQRNSAN